MYQRSIPNADYGKIKVGAKSLEDAVLDLGALKQGKLNAVNKAAVYKALADNDVAELRALSNYFYQTSGIYQKTCNYFANMYRFDWHVQPAIFDEKANNEKIVGEFYKVLDYLDNSQIKLNCQAIALKVIKEGAYYGYAVYGSKGVILQELPNNYCRSRYTINSMPAIEFNMKFFDDQFSDINYRLKVLKLFPPEFAKGYMLYKQGKLPAEEMGRAGSWYLLEPGSAIKFTAGNNDIPLFINAVPAILDLDAAQDLDRRKQMQKLLKIIVQKLPLDKNGELIFDIDEATDLHNNAVQMLSRAIGVDILTTFADIDSIDISDKNTATTQDDLKKVERGVFNSLGISQNLFNTDGNLALGTSVLNDEASIKNLVYQLNSFYDSVARKIGKGGKKYNFRFYFLETTQYNYKDLSKMYKEQTQIGFSKMLPQVALGHSQSEILNTAYFENEVLKLSEIMIPPLMSSTMKGEDVLGKSQQSDKAKSQKNIGEEKTQGRPEKPDDQKSEKTIQNKESMS